MTVREAIEAAEEILPGEPAPEGEIDPRWQAIIEVGEFISCNPDEVWSFAARWGSYPQEDLQLAVATCLLEHLVEFDFDRMFPKVEALAQKDLNFAGTFLSCAEYVKCDFPQHSKRIENLVVECQRRRRWRFGPAS